MVTRATPPCSPTINLRSGDPSGPCWSHEDSGCSSQDQDEGASAGSRQRPDPQVDRLRLVPPGLDLPAASVTDDPAAPSLAVELIELRLRDANLANSLHLLDVQRAKELVWTDPDMALAKCRVVLSREEVRVVFSSPGGVPLLVCSLLCGAGLRFFEALSLRVKDVAFLRHEIMVREGQGRKDRLTILPAAARESRRARPAVVQEVHGRDLLKGRRASNRPPGFELRLPPRRRDTPAWRPQRNRLCRSTH